MTNLNINSNIVSKYNSSNYRKGERTMGVVSKYNRISPFSDIDTKNFNFVSLKDIDDVTKGKPYPIHGLFITKGGLYGDSPVAIGDHVLVNLPNYLAEDVQNMIADDDVVKAIRANKVAIKIEHYENKFSKQKDGTVKTFYTVEWIDL